MPNFSVVAAPLNKKIRKGEPFTFRELHQDALDALESLKTTSVTFPVLTRPLREVNFTVDTDSPDRQVGFVLLQEQLDRQTEPIGYSFRSRNDTEKRYDTTHRECLSILWAVLLL